MKLSFKIGIKGIKSFLQKFPKAIGEHFFLSFLVTFLFALIFGGIVFYVYIFSAYNTKFDILERPVFFNEDIYKKVLEELSNREKVIQELDSKQYSNPFAPISSETGPLQP